MFFHYGKIVGGVIVINTPLASSVALKGLFLIMPGYDSCGEQQKVGIELACPFNETLLKF